MFRREFKSFAELLYKFGTQDDAQQPLAYILFIVRLHNYGKCNEKKLNLFIL